MKKALLVIDVQMAFEDKKWGTRNNPDAEENIALFSMYFSAEPMYSPHPPYYLYSLPYSSCSLNQSSVLITLANSSCKVARVRLCTRSAP